MQLTRAGDYGVRAMVHLASLPAGSRVSLGHLAEACRAPAAFLAKVLQRLAAAGLVLSHRGAAGGFQLNASASQISLLDVVEAMEGPLQLNVCTGYPGAPVCDRQTGCAVHRVWMEAQTMLRHTLAAATLESLARKSGLSSEPKVPFADKLS
jgi:Rrf2 family protein